MYEKTVITLFFEIMEIIGRIVGIHSSVLVTLGALRGRYGGCTGTFTVSSLASRESAFKELSRSRANPCHHCWLRHFWNCLSSLHCLSPIRKVIFKFLQYVAFSILDYAGNSRRLVFIGWVSEEACKSVWHTADTLYIPGVPTVATSHLQPSIHPKTLNPRPQTLNPKP